MIDLEKFEKDPYGALNVKKFINATCHWTMFGGTLLPEVSVRSMTAASQYSVDMLELQRAAGKIIAQYTHSEDGFIVSGCAAAMMVGTAAFLTGEDKAKMEQLPTITGNKTKCISKCFSRRKNADGQEYVDHSYALAVQSVGVSFKEVGHNDIVTREEYERAFNENTALVYWIGYSPRGDIDIKDVIDIAHDHGTPVLIDASNSLPPRENLHRFIDLGADLVCYSGGKGLQGPQGAGIIAGNADLIRSVRMQSAPNHGIGRVCKVSKEEIVAQISSLVWWAEQDEEDRMTEHHRKTLMLADMLKNISGINVSIADYDISQRPYPTVHFSVEKGYNVNGEFLIRELHDGDPAIAVMKHQSDENTIRIDVRLLENKQIESISNRLHQIVKNSLQHA